MPDSADQMPPGQPPNLRNIDPERIVRQLAAAGVEALYVHAKDNQGNCYYDTQVGHKHSGIGERDLLREFAAASRLHGLAILFYVQLTRDRRGHAEPSYAARNADGQPVIIHPALGRPFNPTLEQAPVMCLAGGGRDYILAIVRELAAGYDTDGFWLDCFGWWGQTVCYCLVCQARYQADHGAEIPPPSVRSGDIWLRYFAWRRRLNTLCLHEIERAIRSVRSSLSVTHNNGAIFAYEDWAMSELDDYVTNECQNQDGFAALGLLCRRNWAVKGEAPFEIELWRFNSKMMGISREYQLRPLAQLQAEMAIVTANGGFVQYYDQIRPDGTLDERSVARMRDAFAIIPPMLPGRVLPAQGWRRCRYASLLWSKTNDVVRAGSKLGRVEDPELEGFATALAESGVLYDLITDRELAGHAPLPMEVIVLPNVETISAREAERLRGFVAAGGGLVATYRTSLGETEDGPLLRFALADLFGADYLEPVSYLYSYQKFAAAEEHPLLDGLPRDWPISSWDRLQLKVALHEGVDGLGRIVLPMRGMHMGYPAQEATEYPPVVCRNYRKGRVVYMASPLGEIYGRYGHDDTRRQIANAVRWAAQGAGPVEIDGPPTIEAVLWQAGDGVHWLHLVNTAGAGPLRARMTAMHAVLPVQGVRVRWRGPLARAQRHPCGTPIPFERSAEGAILALPAIEIHLLLELVPADSTRETT
jgi:hypothetical protein